MNAISALATPITLSVKREAPQLEQPLEKRVRTASQEAFEPLVTWYENLDDFDCSYAMSPSPSPSPDPYSFPFDSTPASTPPPRSSPSPCPMLGFPSEPPSPISTIKDSDLEELDPFHTVLQSIRRFGAFINITGDRFVIGKCLGKGDFSIVNMFTGGTRFDKKYSNEDLVISLFKEKVSKRETAVLEEYVTNAKKQYDQLRKLENEFPLALPEILQWPDFGANIPFTIKQKAEYLRLRRWEPDTPFDKLHLDTQNIFTKLKEVLAFGLKHDIAIDLSNWGNLMVLKGQLCLVDFFELPDTPGTFKSNIPRFLKALSTYQSPSRPSLAARNLHIERFLNLL